MPGLTDCLVQSILVPVNKTNIKSTTLGYFASLASLALRSANAATAR